MNYIVNYLHDAGKSIVCLCTVVSCKAYSFMDFCQKKCHTKKNVTKKKERKKKKNEKEKEDNSDT